MKAECRSECIEDLRGEDTAVRKYSAAAHNLLEKSYKGGNAPKEL